MLASNPRGCAPLVRPALATLELLTQLLATDPRVPHDAVERSALEFAVQRHDKQRRVIRMFEADMAAALTHRLPAQLVKDVDELRAGYDRQPLAHAGTGSLRRTTFPPSDLPSSRKLST